VTGAARLVPLRAAGGLGAVVVPRPERWLSVLAGAGWSALLGLTAVDLLRNGARHVDHPVLGLHAVGGLAMVAVMAPLVAPNVRYAALRSPAQVRGRVTLDVASGWAVVWVGVAAVLGVGAFVATSTIGPLAAVALVTALAVLWQHSAVKRRSLTRCHRIVAPPLDRRRSRRTCRRFGVRLGLDCALSCWPLMALMAVAGHDPLIAAGAVGVAWYERRRRPHHDPGTAETSIAIVAIGATACALAVLTA
jgi:predicted metal-binding membrane protein